LSKEREKAKSDLARKLEERRKRKRKELEEKAKKTIDEEETAEMVKIMEEGKKDMELTEKALLAKQDSARYNAC